MTARADNAARELLARLTDEAALESAPLDEVRADLAQLGADPARAIRFSLRLAEQAGSPAGELLAKAVAAEDDDREVAGLESADLRTIQAELAATNPLAAAYAQRLANAATAQPRRRPSRRLWYGVGGGITAIAASVLIFIAVAPPGPDERQLAFAPESLPASAMREQAAAAPPVPAQSSAPATPALQPPTPFGDTPTASAASIDRSRIEALARAQSDQEMSPYLDPRLSERAEGNLPVKAILILEPELAPESLRRSDLGAGLLKAQLPEIGGFPFRKSIVALVTLEQADGTTVDAMLLRQHVQYLRKSEAIPSRDSELLLLEETAGEPQTLRRLLGREIDEFVFVGIKPLAAAEPN